MIEKHYKSILASLTKLHGMLAEYDTVHREDRADPEATQEKVTQAQDYLSDVLGKFAKVPRGECSTRFIVSLALQCCSAYCIGLPRSG